MSGVQKSKKCSIVLAHKPSSSIKSFHDLIKACPKAELKEILGMFRIESGKPKIEEKWSELKEHHRFSLIDPKYLDEAIKQLVGYITKEAIDAQSKWQIVINDFNKDFRNILSKFASDSTPFPSFKAGDVKIPNKTFIFVEKMKNVKFKRGALETALSDYLRAQLSQIGLLSMAPTLLEPLCHYDDDVFRRLTDEKEAHSNNAKAEEIDTDEAHKSSRDLYYCCIKAPHEQIPEINGIKKYYRDGRIHHLVDETDFEWKFVEDDL